MPVFLNRRRAGLDVNGIRPDMGANPNAVRRLEARCHKACIRMTNLRRVLLHGLVEAGPGMTATEIWRRLGRMMQDRTPSPASIQRNLNLFVAHGIVRRDVSSDRVQRYRITPARTGRIAITFVEADTGRTIPCNVPGIASLLRQLAAQYGLAVQGASITVSTTHPNATDVLP